MRRRRVGEAGCGVEGCLEGSSRLPCSRWLPWKQLKPESRAMLFLLALWKLIVGGEIY